MDTLNEQHEQNFSRVCIFTVPFSNKQRHIMKASPKPVIVRDDVKIVKPRMTDAQVMRYLGNYGDRAYDDLPYWLKQEMKTRKQPYYCRKPTDEEMFDTIRDAREHRITNKELVVSDYIDKYKHKISFKIL